jgi:hypothetical protein
MYQEKENLYLEIATKSWYNEYEKFVIKNIKNLCVDNLNGNSNITMDFVLNNPKIKWNTYNLSRNPNITIQDVLNNPQIEWSGYSLSYILNITIQDVLRYIRTGEGLSENTNITIFDVKNNPRIAWYWDRLSYNNMSKGKERYINNKIQELKFINEFKFISQNHRLFPSVIEDIIFNYLFS